MKNFINEITTGECTITLKKTKNGGFECRSEGSRLSTLLTLATAELNILKNLYCDDSEFKLIKEFVTTIGKEG